MKLGSQDKVSFVPMNALGIRKKNFDGTTKPLNEVYGGYTYFADGDVLLAKITPCFQNGKLGIASSLKNGTGFGSSEFFVFRCSNQIDKEYLFYFLSQERFMDEGVAQMSGAVGHQRVPLEFIEHYPISLPPLPVQERIVAILDGAFAAIATAIANAEKNLANAKELFESYRHAIFMQRDDEWVDKKLHQCCTFSSGGTPSKKTATYWNGIIPWVSGKDMKTDRIDDSILHITKTALDESATRMAPVGSLLILVRGMGLANGIPIAELTAPCAFNQDIRAMHPHGDIYPRFLQLSLRDQFYLSDRILSSAAHGTLKINMDILQCVEISIPSLSTQKKIAKQIDSFSAYTNQLVDKNRKKLSALSELKQSLLHKAFTGKLTADTNATDRTHTKAVA